MQDNCIKLLTTGFLYFILEGVLMKNKRLKKARESKKLSQDQLAKLVGTQGKSSVSNWENGYSTPTLETVIKISRVLNRSVEYLFDNKVQVTHTLSEKVVN